MSETLSNQRDFNKPFEIFVGEWNGGVTIFDREGANVAYWPSKVALYWNPDGTLRYQQFLDQLATHFAPQLKSGSPLDPLQLLTFLKEDKGQLIEVDLHIKGKRATGASKDGNYLVQAQESAPGNYLFMLRELSSGFTYCNNHFFLNPNLRQITGPTLATGESCDPKCPTVPGLVQAVNIQTFTRVSYKATAAEAAQAEPKPTPVSKEGWQRALFLKAWVNDEFKKLLGGPPADRTAAMHLLAREHGVEPTHPAHATHIEDLIKDTHDCPPPACC